MRFQWQHHDAEGGGSGACPARTQRPSGHAARDERTLTASAVQHDPRLEVAARLLLRTEGVASSRIEAISAPTEVVALAEVEPTVRGPASWVADNLRAVDAALAMRDCSPSTTCGIGTGF